MFDGQEEELKSARTNNEGSKTTTQDQHPREGKMAGEGIKASATRHTTRHTTKRGFESQPDKLFPNSTNRTAMPRIKRRRSENAAGANTKTSSSRDKADTPMEREKQEQPRRRNNDTRDDPPITKDTVQYGIGTKIRKYFAEDRARNTLSSISSLNESWVLA